MRKGRAWWGVRAVGTQKAFVCSVLLPLSVPHRVLDPRMRMLCPKYHNTFDLMTDHHVEKGLANYPD